MNGTTLAKKTQGYGYKYTELSEIHEWLESQGITYYQYIEPVDGQDYIYTVPIVDGKEKSPRRGCRVIIATLSGKSNPAQEQGSGITYARRYSLLMAFGLATADDDAACLTEKKVEKPETVEAEVVKETPKAKRSKATGYPSRQVMMEVIKKRFPEGSKIHNELLTSNNLNTLDDMNDAQVMTLYNKVGGR